MNPAREHFPWKSIPRHPVHMPEPAQRPLVDVVGDLLHLERVEDCSSGDMVPFYMPQIDAEHGPAAATMEARQHTLEMCRESPAFTTVQEHVQY